MIKAIIFDFGRVISAPKDQELFYSYEAALGLPSGTINTIMFDSPLWSRALVGELTMPQYWHAIGPALNLYSPADIYSFQKRYYDDERINPGVLQLIRKLYGIYTLAVLSNHPPGLIDWLIDWNIAGFFDLVVCSGEEKVAKPDQRSYWIALERLGVKPSEAVFIDDTPGHVAAAMAIGVAGIVYTDAAALEKELTSLLYCS